MDTKIAALANERPLITYCAEINQKASDAGHDLKWNINDPEVYIGRCACGLRTEVRLNGNHELTEEGTLKRCRHSLPK
jgi:hypothetical protein